jgi:phosphoribosylformylglycinamidine synthase PurS subunit
VKATVTIRLRPGVLDCQGVAVRAALGTLGFAGVGAARVGKVIELDLATDDPTEAAAQVEQMCARLLANPVMEDFTYRVGDHPEVKGKARAG